MSANAIIEGRDSERDRHDIVPTRQTTPVASSCKEHMAGASGTFMPHEGQFKLWRHASPEGGDRACLPSR